MERSFFDPRRWLGALLSAGTARGGRSLAVVVYSLLSLLALMQAGSSGAVERIASQLVGRVLFGALAGLLLVVAIAAVAAVVAYTTDAMQPRIGDALLHFSLAAAVACYALAPDVAFAHDGALVVSGLGALVFGTGLVLLVRGGLARGTEDGDLERRDALVRGVVFVAVGAFLTLASAHALPVTPSELLARVWGVPLFLAAAAALLVYVWHSLSMMSQAVERSGRY